MILLILFFGAILFAASMIFMNKGLNKNIWVTIGIFITIGSLVLITLNYTHHLGMKIKTTQTTEPLASSIDQPKVLAYRRLGTGHERIYLYRTNPLATKLTKTNPAKDSVIIKKDQQRAQLIISSHEYVYRNEEYRLLFSLGEQNHQHINNTYQFNLTPNWKVISIK